MVDVLNLGTISINYFAALFCGPQGFLVNLTSLPCDWKLDQIVTADYINDRHSDQSHTEPNCVRHVDLAFSRST